MSQVGVDKCVTAASKHASYGTPVIIGVIHYGYPVNMSMDSTGKSV